MNSFLFPPIKNISSDFIPQQRAFSVTIRPAQMEDINQLADLLTHSFHQPLGITFWIYPLLKLGVCEDLRTRFRADNPDYICLVAEKKFTNSTKEKSEIIGTVELSIRTSYSWHLNKKYIYLANLAVKNSCRRQGIAKKLLLKCEQVAYSWGFKDIYLHVLDNNHHAKNLYFKNGYQINQVDSSLYTWLTRRPKRLFVKKSF